MMNENDKIDELIRKAAEDYNRPPTVVPRDEMWSAIEAARKERAGRPLHIVAPTQRHSIRRYTWLGVAAAAVLLIATGVGIGRWSPLSVPVAASSKPLQKVATTEQATVPSLNPEPEPAPTNTEPEENTVRSAPSVRSSQSIRTPQSARSSQSAVVPQSSVP